MHRKGRASVRLWSENEQFEHKLTPRSQTISLALRTLTSSFAGGLNSAPNDGGEEYVSRGLRTGG